MASSPDLTCSGDYTVLGGGGCPSQCYCDHVNGGSSTSGFCENSESCGASCTTDADCPSTQMCTDSYEAICGGPTCLDSSSCASATKRLAIRGSELWATRKPWAKRGHKLHDNATSILAVGGSVLEAAAKAPSANTGHLLHG